MLLLVLLLAGCNEWNDHNEITNGDLKNDLVTTINNNKDLSTFAGYLTATGYDSVLRASKTYTVWAPTNEALQGVDEAIVNDDSLLRLFVGNHICNQQYFTSVAQPLRIKMLNGKYLTWSGNAFEGVGLSATDKLAKNGVLHIISEPVLPKQSSWQLLTGEYAGTSQVTFLQSLTYEEFVDSLAVQIGIDPNTGQPIYEPGTGMVERNPFLDQVADIKGEDSLYTVILLTDEAFNAEVDLVKNYFRTITADADSMRNYASSYISRDLVFRGLIKPEELPDELTSLFNIKIPLDKSSLLEAQITSNGIVYVFGNLDVPLTKRFPPIVIEGERPNAFAPNYKTESIHYRYRSWASQSFDFQVYDPGLSLFNVLYRVRSVPANKYKIYWRAVNDFATVTHQQRLAIGLPTATTFPYVTVSLQNYSDVYLGEYTVSTYGTLDLYLVGANSSTATVNPLVLDYIRLEPQF